jgi:[ribosomal protein S5]-alanine N-acetyltransferase
MSARVRLIEQSDNIRLAELQRESREFLAPWDPVRSEEYFTAAGQAADIERAIERHERGEALPLVILDEDGELLGRVTLSGIARGVFRSCSMGYWIAESRNGRGYATDAVAAAVALAFEQLELHRVQAETLTHNVGSQRVLEKNGFTQFGMAPHYLMIAGQWQDHVLFQRLNE